MSKVQINFLHLMVILVSSTFVRSAIITMKSTQIETDQFPVFELKCDSATGFCMGQALSLNKTHKHFTPISSIPAEKVKIIHLGGHPSFYQASCSSVMHTFTSDLCQAFPNLKIIDAKYLQLHEIDENALRPCTQLEAVYLASNELHDLDQNLFKYNKNLEKVRLEDNKFINIDLNLFEELRHLNELGFDGQLLSDFHVNKVRHRGIIKLVVRFNDKSVIDLDESGISESYPHLASFIPCYRDQSSIYIRLLESMFEPFAKLYCFERPGNLNQDGELIIEKNDSSILSTVENTID